MNFRNSGIIITLLAITLFSAGIFNSGCYLSDDETRVTIRLQRNDLGINTYIPEKRMIDRVLEFFSTRAYAGGWVDERDNMILTIISTSFEDIVINLPTGATSFTTTVPSASNVTFRITAEGDSIGYGIQKMWGGETVVNLLPGEQEIGISMMPMTWITGAGGSTPITVTWMTNNIPAYVTSYQVYRADTAAGPYVYKGSGTSFFNDSDVVFGRTYYYRVSTVSAYGEGVLSPPLSGTSE
jgi:hypothetical protein